MAKKKIDYASMFTLRKDGRYQAKYKDSRGVWHSVCDRDPERLYFRVQELTSPTVVNFAMVAEAWEEIHREEIGEKTWYNYKPHVEDIVKKHGKTPVDEVTALDVINDLKAAQARTHADRKLIHSDAAEFCRNKMAKLMNSD